MARRESPPRSSGSRANGGAGKKGGSAPSSSRGAEQTRIDDLDELSKKDLVARAEALGIDGAAKFTKIELVDEVRRAAGQHDRGFLGKARDLLKGVVEKGISKALGGDGTKATHAEAARPRATDGVSPHVPDDAPASVPSAP